MHELINSGYIFLGWLLPLSHLDHRSDMLLPGEVFEIACVERWLVHIGSMGADDGSSVAPLSTVDSVVLCDE